MPSCSFASSQLNLFSASFHNVKISSPVVPRLSIPSPIAPRASKPKGLRTLISFSTIGSCLLSNGLPALNPGFLAIIHPLTLDPRL